MNTLTLQAPPIVVVTEADVPEQPHPEGSRLAVSINTHLEFMVGWRLCRDHQPLVYCKTEQQERGWWAYLDGEAGAEYVRHATQRGVNERTINETLGGF